MKKSGFTLLEIVLSLAIFSFLIGIVISMYTNIQKTETKIVNTQKMVQVAQDFSEKMFKRSLECTGVNINNGITTIYCPTENITIKESSKKLRINGTPYPSNNVQIEIKSNTNNDGKLLNISITTNISGEYLSGNMLGNEGFTLTSSYYFDKI